MDLVIKYHISHDMTIETQVSLFSMTTKKIGSEDMSKNAPTRITFYSTG